MAEVRPKPAVLSVTDAAAARIREIVARAENPVAGVRLGVKKGGCAGMTYTMDVAETVAKGDEVVDANGVRVPDRSGRGAVPVRH